jgi:prepilin-type N-terminal cleavage/methylation domain-containing protein
LYYYKHKQFKSLEEKHKMLSKLIKPKSQDSKGFTLIEIVIVLAIAGLIFVIVFLAVQQAQRSRRDTQRRSDAARLAAAVETYAGNNGGNYPANQAQADTLLADYMQPLTNFQDPTSGATYTVTYNNTAGVSNPALATIFVARARQCSGSNFAAAGNRGFAVKIHQESGGAYCVDNI